MFVSMKCYVQIQKLGENIINSAHGNHVYHLYTSLLSMSVGGFLPVVNHKVVPLKKKERMYR